MIDMEIKPYERMVYYYETDRMGIVHHSNYIRWFEEARLAWMKQIGWDYKTIEDDNIIIPVLSVSAEYKTMSRYGDNIVIYVKLAEYTGIRIGFSYEVHDKKTGELRCVGTSCHCLLDENNKPVFMRKRYPEKDAFFKELMKQQAEENA